MPTPEATAPDGFVAECSEVLHRLRGALIDSLTAVGADAAM